MSRESHIEFEMNYCQHYGRKEGSADMECKAGMDLKAIKKVAAGDRSIKWGPCIEGHTLPNPHEYCPRWIRRTREMGEASADAIEASMERMAIVMPVVNEWRMKPKPSRDRREVIECPKCKGRLHLSQAANNGHVHGACETPDCVRWME